jgi:hypothetical protein
VHIFWISQSEHTHVQCEAKRWKSKTFWTLSGYFLLCTWYETYN